jgi:hypothetical protein
LRDERAQIPREIPRIFAVLNEKGMQLLDGHASVDTPREKRVAQDTINQSSAGSLQLCNYQRLGDGRRAIFMNLPFVVQQRENTCGLGILAAPCCLGQIELAMSS